MPWIRYIVLLLGIALVSGTAFANRGYRRAKEERLVACDLPLLPHQSTDLPERLNEFVAREGRLPERSRKEERNLYRRMTAAVTQGRLMMALFDPAVVTLIRRQLFYRNSFFAFLELTDGMLPSELSRFEQRWLSTLRTWGDEPFPEDPRREFESLLRAQAEQLGPDGREVFSDLNAFVIAHGRLPTSEEEPRIMDRLARYISTFDPAILQLNPYARAFVRNTRRFGLRSKELDEAWRDTDHPSPELRFRRALWRWFSK